MVDELDRIMSDKEITNILSLNEKRNFFSVLKGLHTSLLDKLYQIISLNYIKCGWGICAVKYKTLKKNTTKFGVKTTY